MHCPSQSVGRWRFLLRSLRHRNYRLFFCGQSLSLVGTWMSRIVIGWLVYRLTGSAWMLGVVAFIGQIPSFVLVPFAGVWIERWSRHRVLVCTNALSMALSLVMATLAFGRGLAIGQIAAFALLQGILNALDTPARQTFLIEMLEEREDLPNAVALNAGMLTVARLVGPTLAGFLIARAGVGWCFTADGVSYGAALLSLLLMQLTVSAPCRRREEDLWREMAEGFDHLAGSVPIRTLLLLLAWMSLVGMSYVALLPVFAHKILHGGPQTLGILMSSAGAGAFVATIVLAVRRSAVGLARNIGLSALVFGLAILVFGCSRNLFLSVAMLTLAGYTMMQLSAGVNTILQIIAEPGIRARVMGYFTMAFMGMIPFGSLLGGAVAARLGAPHAMLFSGSLCVLSGVVYLAYLPSLHRALRPVYLRLGILPAEAVGVEEAIPVASDVASQ